MSIIMVGKFSGECGQTHTYKCKKIIHQQRKLKYDNNNQCELQCESNRIETFSPESLLSVPIIPWCVSVLYCIVSLD